MSRVPWRPLWRVSVCLGFGVAFCGQHSSLSQIKVYASKGTQPPEVPEFRDPPVETGRNPQAVALDFVWGVVSLPVLLFGLFFAYFFGGFLSKASKPPPSVGLNEALTSLTSIEDDYDRLGPSMGLRQRLAKWFQICEPQRRLDFELQDVEDGRLKEKIRKRGMDAAEDIAAAVEYFIAGNGIIDDSGSRAFIVVRFLRFLSWHMKPQQYDCVANKVIRCTFFWLCVSEFVIWIYSPKGQSLLGLAGSARFADRIAREEASRGYPEAEKFAEQALHEGRKALADTVSMLEAALEEG